MIAQNTAPPRKPVSVATRNLNGSASPIAEAQNSPVVAATPSDLRTSSVRARSALADTARGRHASPAPPVTGPALTARKFSKSPIRGERVGRLTAAFEPNTVAITEPVTSPSLFQSSLSAYNAALSQSTTKVDMKPTKNVTIEKIEVAPMETTATSSPSSDADAIVTPSSIRARNGGGSSRTLPFLVVSPVHSNASVVHDDEGTQVSRSSHGSATKSVVSSSKVDAKKGIATTPLPPPPPPSPSPSMSRWTPDVQSDLSISLDHVIKKEMKQMESRLENQLIQTLEHQLEIKKRGSSSETLDLSSLRMELEESLKRQMKQTENRLEQYCNRRLEQMETQVNERLQQIRSSLQEFLMIAESEGIFPAASDGPNHSSTIAKKGGKHV